jgi:hypothetical protein
VKGKDAGGDDRGSRRVDRDGDVGMGVECRSGLGVAIVRRRSMAWGKRRDL